ncbi:hypothetical protein PRIPAC_79593 [Pristionchus pacificus]|uniref:aspartate transaminase n=1 Tax=Pristionchus pacificus TaxID=54126 RepID=A0A454XR33_PRIPA|nr:hypothetical protein PRIPAC_79593 [Pristionchus pacificus]|eukprot:PDM79725.1 hypothetical protein PRIPAC_32304 [Pristionchus pacificus]
MSFFTDVVEAAPIEVFHMDELFSQDPSPNKVNLSIGAYRTEEGRPWVLPVVRNAEVALANDLSLDHEYLPLLGHEQFCRAATELVLGEDSPAIVEGKAIGVQCLSGTGSLRLGAEFLHTKCEMNTVYLSRPTWGNHILVFQTAGFEEFREYAYWDENNNGIDIEGMIGDLEQAPERHDFWLCYSKKVP